MWGKYVIESLFGLSLLFNAFCFVPQIIKVMRFKNAREVSLLTFAGFLAIQLLTILHATLHHDYILLGGTAISFMVCGILTYLIVYYNYFHESSVKEIQQPQKFNIDSKQTTQEMAAEIRQHHCSDLLDILPGHVYWRNKELINLGCNHEQALCAGYLDTEKHAQELRKNDMAVITSGKTLVFEEAFIDKNGLQAVYLTHKTPLKNKKNEVVGLAGVSLDITKYKASESTLAKAKKTADAANQAKTNFILNMEHDTRVPLGGIYNAANLMAEQESDPEKNIMLKEIARSSRGLMEYCKEILDYSKIESHSLPLMEKSFTLKKLLDTVIEITLPAAKSKSLKLNIDYDISLPEIVIADPYRLRRILINLLNNSIKFTEQGQISLSAKFVKQNNPRQIVARFTVEDTGIGFPENKKHLIYEQFSQISASQTLKGNGLGLRIVKKFMQDMHGDINLRTSSNKGTSFICTLPLTLPLIADMADEEFVVESIS